MSEEIKPKKERKFLKSLGRVGEILVEQVLLKLGSSIIKKIGGKKTLPSILFLFLSLSLFAQFPNTLNKQRLGFQTTGDGLVWRGTLSDTASIQPVNNQNAWVILDTINLKFYSFDFSSNVWNLVGGAQGLTMPFDSITFNTAKNGTVGVGEVEYNDTQGSLIQGLKGGNVTNVIGQQLHQRVNNRTGAPLAKGDVVYLAGSQGNRITVAKGLAVSDAFSANTFGVVAESIADNQSGFIITEGLITGLNTSALTEDSAVYLSPTVAGALTSTKPQAPQHSVYIGVCVKSNNGSGELFVKIRNGQELDELHDTRITNPVTGATLYYSGGLWRDTTAALLVSDTASMLIPYFRDADTTSLNLTSRFATKLNISDTASMLNPYLRKLDTTSLSNRINLKVNISDTLNMLVPYLRKADTTNMLLPYFRDADTTSLNLTSRFATKLNISDTSVFARDNQISGTSGQVAYFNSSNSVISDAGLIYNATNKSLGINTTTTSGANLIIKNSQEPSRATVVSTQTFAADTTNWTRGTGWTFNGTQAVATAATGNLTYTPALTITSGNAYEIRYTLTNYSAGTLTIAFGNGSYLLPTHNATANVILLLPTGATGGFRFTTSSFTGNIDDVSVVEITNRAPILFSGQDDNSATLYNSLRMPNSSTLAFGGGAANTTSSGIFLGAGTGLNNTTGTNNIFVGSQTGEKNTTGSNNVFLGTNSGRENNTGFQNVFMGNASGRNNTTGGNNIFIGSNSGFTNTTGSNNYFAGSTAGQFNTTGSDNVFIGPNAGQNNTTGFRNVILGTNAGLGNTTGASNFFFGQSAGRSNTTGNSNIAIGDFTFNQNSTTTGGANLFFGGYAGGNITGSASGNVIIGNAADLPDPSGSNQVVIKNVYFATGASGSGTGIAALSKAGIKTNAPNRDLEVAGEVRITDLTTDTPTRLVGADADGDLGQVTLGAGLSLASSSLLADTSFLVTRFDTASMLTNYLRSGVAASTYQTILTNPITGTGTTNYISKFTGTSTLGNSLINDNGNYIGINKSNPTVGIDLVNDLSSLSAKLRLQTNFANAQRTLELGSGDGLSWDLPGSTSQSPFIKVIGGDQTFGGGGLNLMTNNTSRLFIRQNGTIGIGTITPNATFEVHGSAVFNEGAADADFRVESVGNANMVFVDASTDRVGIGYASPTKTLDVNGEVRINTLTATPTSLLGKDGSNVVGEVTTVAQTGIMKSGGTTANTSSVGIITVAHGLSYTPSQVIATISQQNSYVIVCHSKDATNLSFTVYDSVTGNPLNNVSVGFFWLAIK